MLHSSLLALALLHTTAPNGLAAPGGSYQVTQCSTDTVPFGITGWSNDVTFDKFDPDLGTLTGVSVRLTATIRGQASIESLVDMGAFTTMTFSANCAIFRPGGIDAIASVTPQQQFMQSFGPYDGVTDFAGTSGDMFPVAGVSSTQTHTSPLPLSDLALFTGTGGAGSAGTILLPVVANGTSTGSGAGNAIFQFMQEASAEVEVCYTYTPVGLCDSDSVPLTPTNWVDSVTVGKFDPDLGILTDVIVTLSGTIQGSAAYESPDASPATITLDYAGLIEVFRPGGTSLITAVNPQVVFVDNASAFDGIFDFDGTSGESYPAISVSEVSTHSSPAPISDLALFTGAAGAGSPGTITLPTSGLGNVSISGAGGLVIGFTQSFSATVTVCYLFDEDCNQNGIADDEDIANATSFDLDGNAVPDECGPPVSICNGDGGNGAGCTDCPCMNNAPPGTIGGCLNSAGSSARLHATGDLSASLPPGSTSDLRFAITGAPPLAFCILNSGDAVAPGGMANPCFGMNSGVQATAFDGLRCAILNTRRHGGRSADSNGEVGSTNSPWGGEASPLAGIASAGAGFASGQTRFFQVINRDDPMASCMRGLNTSQAIAITFTP